MDYTYVIGDLHGRVDLLEAAIEVIESRPTGTVVFLGDYVDRGPWSRQVIERLKRGPADNRWRWVVLKGNHEDIMVQAYQQRSKLDWWFSNGGDETLVSYGWKDGADPIPRDLIPHSHIEWLRLLPVSYEDGYRVFVHAGVDPMKTMPLQDAETILWKIYENGDDRGCGDLHVVHGHHHQRRGPLLLRGRSNFDTWAYYTGRLVIGVFDDMKPGGPVDSIEIKKETLDELRNAGAL